MQVIKNRFWGILLVIVAAVMLMPTKASAQTFSSSVNTYSPYSMYGLGELATPGDAATRSMGGAGVAMFSMGRINMLNPAAYANTARKSFLFHFGVDAGHYRNTQNKYAGAENSTIKTAYNTVNFHDIAFQMPLAKNVGLGFSLTPYSNVGYNMFKDEYSSDIAGTVGRIRYNYKGEGDVTEVKLGVGWRPTTKFSIGVAALYYWGSIKRQYSSIPMNIITGNGSYSNTTGVDNYSVSRFKMQAGVQWHAIMNSSRILSFGATYDLGGELAPGMTRYVYVDNFLTSVVRDESEEMQLKLPQQVTVGTFYQTNSIRLALDYVYQDWGAQNDGYAENIGGKGVTVAYTDTHTIKAGFEITPKPTDVRHYLNRVSYRLGVRYGDYYQTYQGCNIKQFAVTAGLGLPIRLFGSSSIDIGFEFGMREPQHSTIQLNEQMVGMVKQRYYKLSIGLAMFGEDRWFQRYKFE